MHDPLLQLRDETEFDEVLKAQQAVIFKHSTRCGISTTALLEVRHFADTNPGLRVYIVDVIAQRPLSRAIADRLGIRHASPQAIVLEGGKPVWHATHFRISSDALRQAVTERQTTGGAAS